MQISLVFKENVPYYSPAVLPYYVEGKISRQSLFPEGWDFYKENRIEIVAGKRVNTLIAKEKKVKLDDNSEIFYDKLLIATGASPFVPALDGINNKGVFVFRTLSDAENILRNLKTKVSIIGAGPAAIELAIALRRRGLKVTVIARSRVMRRLFDPDLSRIITKMLRENDVQVLTDQKIARIEGNPVCGIATGVKPNTDFIKDSKIRKGESGGIIVNEKMQSSVNDIFAAGDCAEVVNCITGDKDGECNMARCG